MKSKASFNEYQVHAKVWIYPGMAGWHFVSVDKRQSAKIKQLFRGISGGFGSLPVTVTIRETTWKTSIFPDKKSATYLLPLKADVRKKEKIQAGDRIKFTITIKM